MSNNTRVKFETFEEVDERQKKQLEKIKDWNDAMRGSEVCQPTYTEEMNLNGDPEFRYVGKGSLWGK